jgi:Fe2+ or Zn2+ uptake regulation protein
MRDVDELTELWRTSGHRLTPQRLAIFRVLSGNESHPTAEDIYPRLVDDYPSLSRNTVYSTLHELAKLGEIKEIFIERNVSHFDPDDHPHAHARCRGCGRVDDLELDLSSPAAEQVKGLSGFKVERLQILMTGLCVECAAS